MNVELFVQCPSIVDEFFSPLMSFQNEYCRLQPGIYAVREHMAPSPSVPSELFPLERGQEVPIGPVDFSTQFPSPALEFSRKVHSSHSTVSRHNHTVSTSCPFVDSVFSQTIMEVIYGITIEEESDPYVTDAEEALKGLAEAGSFGAFLVDILSIMKYIPSWFPGAQWKKKAEEWNRVNGLVQHKPFQYVKNQMVRQLFAFFIRHSNIQM